MVGEIVYQLLFRVESRCPELGFKTPSVALQSYILLLYLWEKKKW